ncbi:hypothetical protein CEE39_00770 [bacterium (candidate division B38) B3_B38]|nr:MAG: hypothetical protein CEE39_00770 [bacterium (candidate division B38) B3_B38]
MNAYRLIKDLDRKYWPSFLKDVYKYIENNYTRKLYLGEIAKRACLSKHHFCRVFKTLTGQTVMEYVNNIRIEKAKELLRKTFFSITEICFEVGFTNISNFNRTFKKIAGVAPSKYRKIQQNNIK